MMDKHEAEPHKIVKLTRWLQNDIRPMEGCCGHHLLAHDTVGCLITGCECRRDHPETAGDLRWNVAVK